MRTRATFPEWGLTFKVHYRKEVFSTQDIIDKVDQLGRLIGMSDCRHKRGGRFEIVSSKEVG